MKIEHFLLNSHLFDVAFSGINRVWSPLYSHIFILFYFKIFLRTHISGINTRAHKPNTGLQTKSERPNPPGRYPGRGGCQQGDFPREGVLPGNIDGVRRSSKARGGQDSRVMAAFLMVLRFDGGEEARARPVVSRHVPEPVSHGVEVIQIIYELSTNPSRLK